MPPGARRPKHVEGDGKLRYRKELLKKHGDPEYAERRDKQNREKSRRAYQKRKEMRQA